MERVTYSEGLYEGDDMPDDVIEEEIRVDREEIGDPILESEFNRALEELGSNRAEGIDNIPAEFLKSLGEVATKRLFKLVCRIYESGEIPSDFGKNVIHTIPKMARADKCENYRTISLTAHASKLLTRIIYRRMEKKIEGLLGDDQFGFRKGVGTREAVLTLRLIMEARLKKNQDTFIGFVDLEKAFDNVKWCKMFEILRKIGISYRERRVIHSMYKNQEGIIRVGDQERSARIKKGVRQGCSLSSLLFNIYIEQAMTEIKERFETGVKIHGERISMIRFADDITILSESEDGLQEVLNGMDNLMSTEYGLRVNRRKTKVMRSSRNEDSERLTIKVSGHEVEEVKEFCYLGCKVTHDGRSKEDIKSRLAQARRAFMAKRSLLVSNISLSLRKKFLRTYVWSTALYGSESWTVGRPDKRRIEAFEMWCYRRMLKIRWTDKVTNEEVLRRIGEERNIWVTLTRRRDRMVGHVLRHQGITSVVLEGAVEGKNCRGRQRFEYIQQIAEDVGCHSYSEMKRLAQDRNSWRAASNQSKD